jgi:DNA repair protein RecO (recombination protein O)
MAGRRSFRSSRAFLIRAADMGEADRRLTFFTESAGAVTVVAKAAHRSRKRFGGVLQKYFLLDLSWSEEQRRLPILSSASILEAFWDILANWERVRYADYLLELVSALFPQTGPKPKAFALLLAGIRSLSGGEPPLSVGRKMEVAFLAAGGWGPDLSACRRCGKAEGRFFRFVVSEGRLYCEACAEKGVGLLSLGAVRTLRALQTSSPSTIGRVRIPEKILLELQIVIPKYIEWNFGKTFRSLRIDSTGRKP